MNTATLDRRVAFESDEESLLALTAKLLGLKAVRSEVDLIERLEKGLTIASVHSLRLRANLTDAETYQLIAPRRTLNRRSQIEDNPSTAYAYPMESHECHSDTPRDPGRRRRVDRRELGKSGLPFALGHFIYRSNGI